MSNIYKAQPDRDLQCYFEQKYSYPYMYGAPTGIAAIISATPTSMTLEGTANDQYDWSCIEWNRDNIFEHIDRRNLPNGDWTGLTLTYREVRSGNIVPFDSFLFDWQDWSYLRIFTGKNADVWRVRLRDYATPGPGAVKASTTFRLSGSRSGGGNVNLTSMGENYWTPIYRTSTYYSFYAGSSYPYSIGLAITGTGYSNSFTGSAFADIDDFGGEPLSTAVTRLASAINADSACPFSASASGITLTVTSKGTHPSLYLFTTSGPSVGGTEWVSGASPTDFSDVYASIASGSGATSSSWYDIVASSDHITFTAKNAGSCYNRLAIYSSTDNSSLTWDGSPKYLTGGVDPDYHTITLHFGTMQGTFASTTGTPTTIPVNDIRAMRWTFSPDMQHTADPIVRSMYMVTWTNWSVSGGSTATYKYAGKNSTLICCDDPSVSYTGDWQDFESGNYTGGRVRATTPTPTPPPSSPRIATASMTYTQTAAHSIYLGTRALHSAGNVQVIVDGGTPKTFDLWLTSGDVGEDRMIRLYVGDFAAGTHTVIVKALDTKNTSSSDTLVYFNFIQAAVLVDLPRESFEEDYSDITLATDWDTEHTLAHSPNRIIDSLDEMGFIGRTNHYLGALKWYHVVAANGTMASAYADFTFTGSGPVAGATVSVFGNAYEFKRTMLYGETMDTLLSSICGMINNGSISICATYSGNRLTMWGRNKSGSVNDPNLFTFAASSSTGSNVTVTASGTTFSGGIPYQWVVDKSADTAINYTTWGWLGTYFDYLRHKRGVGSDGLSHSAILAFSQELGHEPKTSSLAAMHSDGTPNYVNTPALMCNFGPDTKTFFQKAFLEVAQMMAGAGLEPYMQFGEVQWWYFPTTWDISKPLTGAGDYWQTASSMAYYDPYTKAQFTARYGGTMHTFVDGYDTEAGIPKATAGEVIAAHPHECELIPSLIGEYTNGIMAHVRETVPNAKFQVLYSLEVNTSPVASIANQPSNDYWGSPTLDSFKAEGFGWLSANNLTLSQTIVDYPYTVRNFSRKNSHSLVGCSNPYNPFVGVMSYAVKQGTGDKVLWAFDQFCFQSHKLPMFDYDRSGVFTTWHFHSLGM